jgi:hypothetical protein
MNEAVEDDGEVNIAVSANVSVHPVAEVGG